MSEQQHTPGPWRIAPISSYPRSKDGYLNIDAESRGYICLAGKPGDTEAEANAHLIAAALEMYEALKWIASQQDLFFAECSQAEAIIERCKHAIAKAEGRS